LSAWLESSEEEDDDDSDTDVEGPILIRRLVWKRSDPNDPSGERWRREWEEMMHVPEGFIKEPEVVTLERFKNMVGTLMESGQIIFLEQQDGIIGRMNIQVCHP
jgi:hypothetical protein